jgi:hypothetical protein
VSQCDLIFANRRIHRPRAGPCCQFLRVKGDVAIAKIRS